MAKLKQKILVSQKYYNSNSGIVYMPSDLIADLKAIDGITSVLEMSNGVSWIFYVDPRYDFDEIVAEIENLDTPIPAAFTDDTPEAE